MSGSAEHAKLEQAKKALDIASRSVNATLAMRGGANKKRRASKPRSTTSKSASKPKSKVPKKKVPKRGK
jgi:hypothetical protein